MLIGKQTIRHPGILGAHGVSMQTVHITDGIQKRSTISSAACPRCLVPGCNLWLRMNVIELCSCLWKLAPRLRKSTLIEADVLWCSVPCLYPVVMCSMIAPRCTSQASMLSQWLGALAAVIGPPSTQMPALHCTCETGRFKSKTGTSLYLFQTFR